MTAVKSFQMAVKKEAGEEEQEPLTYEFVEADGSAREIVARYPGEGALMLLLASVGDDENVGAASELFALLAEAFSKSDMAFLKKAYRSGAIETETLMDLVMDMVERWSAFPTQQQSGSSGKQPSTGAKSTGRAPGAGSTRSASA